MASVRNRDDLDEIYMYDYAQYLAHYNNSHHRTRKTIGHMGNLHNCAHMVYPDTTLALPSFRQIHPYNLVHCPNIKICQCIVHWNNDIQS